VFGFFIIDAINQFPTAKDQRECGRLARRTNQIDKGAFNQFPIFTPGKTCLNVKIERLRHN
jgi:hypothetical protein